VVPIAALLGLLAGVALWRAGNAWAGTLAAEPTDRRAPATSGPARPTTPARARGLGTLFAAGCGGYACLAAARLGDEPPALARTLLLAGLLLLILLIDARTRLIPNLLLVAGAAAGLGLAAIGGPDRLLARAAAAAGAALVFGLLWKAASVLWRASAEAPFGEGDVLLAGVVGAMVGPAAVAQALFLGALLAGVASLVGLLAGRVDRTDVVPYGPFLCLGALVALLR